MFSFPLHEIYSSKFILDFIAGDISLANFISTDYQLKDFKSQLSKKDFSIEKRRILSEVIASQYESTGLPNPESLELLLAENTFTVTTGHQLCLFGGPQYFIHKIISVISLAHKLKVAYPEYNFIPIFWMASEDHDFDEISSVKIFNENIKVEGENSRLVGRIPTNEFSSSLEELEQLFKNDSRGEHLISIFKEAFNKNNWADCTRYWVNQLFKKHGLVIVDADSLQLKNIFSSIIELEIKDQFIYNQVEKTNKELVELGYKPQVNPREINLFYILDGERIRIIFENNQFRIGDDFYSEIQICDLIKSNPENFSPNVLMRPLYQECILPNLAYIGGPAEIAYWGQLKGVFNVSNILFPKLLLRDHFGWINKADLAWWKSNQLDEKDLLVDFDVLANKIILKDKTLSFDLENDMEQIRIKFQNEITAIDPSILGMLNGELAKFQKGLNKIQSKLNSASKRKNELFYNKVKKIQKSLINNKVLNERVDGFIPVYVNLDKDYLKSLIEFSNPFESNLKIIVKD